MTREEDVLNEIRQLLKVTLVVLIVGVVIFSTWAVNSMMDSANAADSGKIQDVNIHQIDGRGIGFYGTPLPVVVVKK